MCKVYVESVLMESTATGIHLRKTWRQQIDLG